MEAIRVFRMDLPLPKGVKYDFSGCHRVFSDIGKPPAFDFTFNPPLFSQYRKAFSAIQREIVRGNSFLTNLTFATPLNTSLTMPQIFERARARYKIMIDGEFVCFSPETFVRIQNGIISTFPMKGTIDAAIPNARRKILGDPKEMAEHHTVVDLLRNDLSMISSDVTVKRFRYVEKIATHKGDILQVSSEIHGYVGHDYRNRLGSIIFALLPAGSVTGAPKAKTVELIRKTEASCRGYYTGICGFFDGESLDSAVMIRFIETRNHTMFFRSGGGITYMSRVRDEYHELISKIYVPIA
jgi:para-aminobenzoate synthetase component 1